MKFKEVGVQLATHLANEWTTPQLVQLAQLAYETGIDRVWVDDNLRFRNALVVLASIASKVPIGLGTAVLVPYFRNPIDLTDALAAISELTQGKELSIGLGRGSTGIVPYQLHTDSPIQFMREYVTVLRRLISGEEITINDFPRLKDYYGFKDSAKFRLAFRAMSPIKLYQGCVGLKTAQMASKLTDGIIVSGLYLALLRTGRIDQVIKAVRSKNSISMKEKEFHLACEINLSVSENRSEALEHPKNFLAHVIPGTYDALGLIDPLGLDKTKVETMKEELASGIPFDQVAKLVSDSDVRKCFIAGTFEECKQELGEVLDQTLRLGFDKVSFKLGPNYDRTIRFIGREIVPEFT